MVTFFLSRYPAYHPLVPCYVFYSILDCCLRVIFQAGGRFVICHSQCTSCWTLFCVLSHVLQSGLEKNVFGNHLVSLSAENRVPPPAFASEPIMRMSSAEDTERGGASSINSVKDSKPMLSLTVTDDKYSELYSTIGVGSSKLEPEIVEVDGPNALENQFMQDQEPHLMKSVSLLIHDIWDNNWFYIWYLMWFWILLSRGFFHKFIYNVYCIWFFVLCFIQPGAATRKPTFHGRQNSETSYYADDEDGTSKKYTRRGKIIQQTLSFHVYSFHWRLLVISVHFNVYFYYPNTTIWYFSINKWPEVASAFYLITIIQLQLHSPFCR